uniref:DUF4743 domain-containing protein n=1 Tax=Odontella aurita TaxID=265563 RepID=A0A7S4K4A5_9STRA|mmetsp:Transcript_61218/g.181048  ORF Transcript_61218/g.181048 Transcript_61218/m.181048 type:complete len:333 (+) Transcript_61218:323-1321(+)
MNIYAYSRAEATPLTLLERIQSLDATRHVSSYVAFVISGHCVGQIHRRLIPLLLSINGDGRIPLFSRIQGRCGAEAITLDDDLSTNEERTRAMNIVTDDLIRNGIIKCRHGDRYGLYNEGSNVRELLCMVDRNAASCFGATSVGVHLLCYRKCCVRTDRQDSIQDCDAGSVSLWMAQRSESKSSFPLKWDPTVAGGQPTDLSFVENLVKEANEEAGIDDSLARRATAVSCLSQMTSKPNGTCMKQSLYHCWDLEVDENFLPYARDGEVTKFELWDSDKLEDEVRQGNNLRPAMRLVVVDFLIRHGIIKPDDEQNYATIQAAMHRERLILWSE